MASHREERQRITVRTKSTVHMALVFGVTPAFKREYIISGSVLLFTPATKALTITSSKLMANEISMPEITAGNISGRVIS